MPHAHTREAVTNHAYTLSGGPYAGTRKRTRNRQPVTGAQGLLQLGFTKFSLSISEHFGVMSHCDR